jgi:predicted nucleic acid-binding protein
LTADSSVLIAAFAPWHDAHESARPAVRGLRDLVAHAELETYSTLTRLPEQVRAPAPAVAEFLAQFAGSRLTLDAHRRRGLVRRLSDLGISGGAVYDAVIAATAADHRMTLLTLDRRAARVYERLGVDYRLLG